MAKTPLKKVIKAKIKANKGLSEMELMREKIKYEIATELGLNNRVDELGWGALTAEETGRIGGIMTKKKKAMNLPKNKDI
ncbi:MAG: small, acid-soluble spore protein, alpha/beta type [Clostridium sp.]